jgi:hypothetical protein
MPDTCTPASILGNSAPSTVESFLTDIKSDISQWASSADGALSNLESMVSGSFSSSVYDFSVSLGSGGTIGDISAPRPNAGALEPGWSPGTAPEYNGPTVVPSVPSPEAPSVPTLSVSFTDYNPRTPGSVVAAVAPAPLDYPDIGFDDPGQRPDGQIGPVANYNAPMPINPNLDALKFSTITAPDRPTVATPSVVFPIAPRVDAPTFSGPPEVSVYQPSDIGWGDIGERPDWTGVPRPNFDYSGEPGAFAGSEMPDAPTLTNVTMPTYSGPDDPTAPELSAITIPTIRDVTLPEFDGISVTQETLPTLTGGLSYTDPGYDDAQLDELRTEISRVLNGGVGIPAHLWDAVWDKASVQIVREGVARERQGRQAWAKLGWNMPGGIALAQQEQAAHDINQQLSEKAREQAIQRATMEREDFWQAVQHGVAFQKLLTDLYNATQERQLRAQVAMVEAMVNIYNANVARYNTNLQRAQAEIAVKELELRGALAQLDVDKGKMEGAKVEAEVQSQVVQTYTAEWEGVRAAVAKYQAMVEAKQAELDTQRLRVQTYGEEVKARAVEVDAWAKEWDGYVAKIEGQKAKAQVYEAEARVFSERMKGFGISSDAEKSRVDAQVRSEQLQLEKSRTEIENFRAKWTGLEASLNAELKAIDSRVQAYGSEVQAKASEAQTRIEGEKLKVGVYDSEVRGYGAEIQGVGTRAQAIAQLYGAEADRYRADTQGAMAEVDASSKKTQAEAQAIDAKARAYTAAVDGERARTEAAGRVAAAEAQRYQAEAQVERTKVDADIARYEGELKAEEIKVRGKELEAMVEQARLQSQSEAYRTQVAAFEAQVRQSVASAELFAKEVDAARTATEAQASAYESNSRVEASRLQAVSQLESAKASCADAEANWATAKARVEGLQADAQLKEAELNQRGMIESAKLSLQEMLSLTEVQAKGLESLGQMYSQLVAGAYSAANISASLGSTFNESLGHSTSCQESHTITYEGSA